MWFGRRDKEISVSGKTVFSRGWFQGKGWAKTPLLSNYHIAGTYKCEPNHWHWHWHLISRLASFFFASGRQQWVQSQAVSQLHHKTCIRWAQPIRNISRSSNVRSYHLIQKFSLYAEPQGSVRFSTMFRQHNTQHVHPKSRFPPSLTHFNVIVSCPSHLPRNFSTKFLGAQHYHEMITLIMPLVCYVEALYNLLPYLSLSVCYNLNKIRLYK